MVPAFKVSRFQGFNPNATTMGEGFGKYFSNPMQSTGGLGKSISEGIAKRGDEIKKASDAFNRIPGGGDPALFNKNYMGDTTNSVFETIKKYIPTSFTDLKDPKKAMGGIGLLAAAGGAYTAFTADEAIDEIMDRGGGMDVSGIRTEL